jgi:hypothetical protein
MKLIDITGKRFGRLQVLGRSQSRPTIGRMPVWVCQCDCGNVVLVQSQHLRDGRVKSCGCLRREMRKNHLNRTKAEKAKVHFYVDKEFDEPVLE